MKNKVLDFVFILFSIIGFVFITVAVVVYIKGKEFADRADRVEATIVDMVSYYDSDDELRYNVFVDYEYEGNMYTDILINGYSSNMHEGENITLLVDPEDPYHVETTANLIFLCVLFLGLGVVFALIGSIGLASGLVHKKKVAKLLETGRCLYATVDSIDYNPVVIVNGENPLVLECSYCDEITGVTYRFKSDNLWTDPGIVYPVGSTVPVYVDANDYSKYHVDVETRLNAKVIDFT